MNKDEISANIAAYIKKYRGVSGITQAELAKRTGLTVQRISAYANGRRMPSIVNLLKLADAMDIGCNDIIYNGALNVVRRRS